MYWHTTSRNILKCLVETEPKMGDVAIGILGLNCWQFCKIYNNTFAVRTNRVFLLFNSICSVGSMLSFFPSIFHSCFSYTLGSGEAWQMKTFLWVVFKLCFRFFFSSFFFFPVRTICSNVFYTSFMTAISDT